MTKDQIDWELVDVTAKSVGVPYFTRRKWRERNRIPAHWWPVLQTESGGRISIGHLQALIPMRDAQRQDQPEVAQ